MLPEGFEHSGNRGVIGILEEASDTPGLGGAILGEHLVGDVDLKLLHEEFVHGAVGEIEDVSTAHVEDGIKESHLCRFEIRHTYPHFSVR